MSTLFCPIAALAVNVIMQVFLYRLRRGAQFFRSIVEGFLSGATAFAGLEVMLAPEGDSMKQYIVLALLVNAPIYVCLSYCAYNFIQLGQTSIRIRMYSDIAAMPSGMAIEEMKREYNEDALLRIRLQRLIESGDIMERNGRYFITRTRFLHVANIIFTVRRTLLGRESEFE